MSWRQLQAILHDAAVEERAAEIGPPTECPCGLPLEQGPDGILFCSFDGTQWPRDRDLFVR